MSQGDLANSFTLQGNNTRVLYEASSINGQPHLVYADGEAERTFDGSEIRLDGTLVGDLVSVELSVIPDRGKATLTVLIPTVRMGSSPEAEIKTVAIKTDHHDSIRGNPSGQTQSYSFIDLTGTAQIEKS